jgi:hypothetical protein
MIRAIITTVQQCIHLNAENLSFECFPRFLSKRILLKEKKKNFYSFLFQKEKEARQGHSPE